MVLHAPRHVSTPVSIVATNTSCSKIQMATPRGISASRNSCPLGKAGIISTLRFKQRLVSDLREERDEQVARHRWYEPGIELSEHFIVNCCAPDLHI